MDTPCVTVIVPTFERPRSLRLVLRSLELQTGLSDHDMEIVVADDGSQDETEQVVDEFRKRCRFNVLYTRHRHDGFQAARTRNDGVRASTAPYLIFLDGDCVAPPGHVTEHLSRRRPKTAMAGFCYYLDGATSERIDDAAISTGTFLDWVTPAQRKQLDRMDRKARFYTLIRHPRRPKLYSGDFSISRRDFEFVNGFNEEFTGWGCEDDEFCVRLHRAGIAVRSILRWTRSYHLWHPPAPSYPRRWQDGVNVQKLQREVRRSSPRCTYGLNDLAPRPADAA
jgi:glycosyltransferase involved in cell wall biosynthesis